MTTPQHSTGNAGKGEDRRVGCVQVFDSDGRYLNVFKPDGVAFGMVFNDKNELLVVARNKVMKFALNQ